MSAKKYAYVNSEILAWARNTTPFTSTRDVEEKIKIKSDRIDAWEKGEEYPSITEAKKLANLYKIPFATFYLSSPPEREPRPYTDRRTQNGTIYGLTSYELWAEIERIIGNRDSLLALIDEEDTDLYETLPNVVFDDSVETISRVITEYLGISLPFKNKSKYGNNPFKYYRTILENKGILVSQVSGISLSEMKGLSLYFDNFPIIAVNNKDYDRAKAFSLIHELAHLFRRSSSLCLIDFDTRNDEEEKKCDAIAAEVMMPRVEFCNIAKSALASYKYFSDECLNYIADKFGVSVFSVIRRLHETAIITSKTYKLLYDEYAQRFKEIQEEIDYAKESKSIAIPFHVRFLNKEGYLYTRTVLNSYAKGSISYGEMCGILGIKGSHISKMERAVMNI